MRRPVPREYTANRPPGWCPLIQIFVLAHQTRTVWQPTGVLLLVLAADHEVYAVVEQAVTVGGGEMLSRPGVIVVRIIVSALILPPSSL